MNEETLTRDEVARNIGCLVLDLWRLDKARDEAERQRDALSHEIHRLHEANARHEELRTE